MKRIGILGGGQLGAMLQESLYRFGAEVIVYDPDPGAPAAQRTRQAFTAPWNDVAALRRFAAACDVATYEFENVEAEPLAALAGSVPIFPSASVLSTTQHRLTEKQFLVQAGLPHVPFRAVPDAATLQKLAPGGILKTVRGGYDGKGQWSLEAGGTLPTIPQWPCVLEEKIDIACEVSCIVGRDQSGREVVFPLFENRHRNHILDITTVPADVPESVCTEVQQVAREAARRLQVVGLLTTEFFLSRTAPPGGSGRVCEGWTIYVNELAPRPHNSGHVTRNAFTESQFDVLARILLDLPMHAPEPVDNQAWAMGNLLGDLWRADETLDLDTAWSAHPDILDVVLYGKTPPRAGRKMGHCIARAPRAADALRSIESFRSALKP